MTAAQPISGHVFHYGGKRRPVWRAKYRLPGGRQVQKTIGPAWTARGRPPAGHWTKRTDDAWLRRLLVEAAAGTLPGMVRAGGTVADACEQHLRYLADDGPTGASSRGRASDPLGPPDRSQRRQSAPIARAAPPLTRCRRAAPRRCIRPRL